MSVLLIEKNQNGKYEFTKEELQTLLDKVEQEAFEQGVSFGRKVQESNKSTCSDVYHMDIDKSI